MQTANDLTLPAPPLSKAEVDAGFVAAVVDVLRARTGCDFSAYRRGTVERRIANRMLAVGVRSRSEYLGLLEFSPLEPHRLLERITIKVSRFYRHRLTFDHLRAHVLPDLARLRGGAALNIWSVGCGGGEEPYTLAMLLEEAGIGGLIEASDVDAAVLDAASWATFSLQSTAELPSELAQHFLEPIVVTGQPRYRVSRELRARVRFSHFDVTRDAPPPAAGPFDLVSCRNVLIYLEREAQIAAIRRLIDATADDGVLCLGEAEWPPSEHMPELEPLPHRTRLFRVRPRVAP
jgi:chemotaxis methyl-accepting protein methylase